MIVERLDCLSWSVDTMVSGLVALFGLEPEHAREIVKRTIEFQEALSQFLRDRHTAAGDSMKSKKDEGTAQHLNAVMWMALLVRENPKSVNVMADLVNDCIDDYVERAAVSEPESERS